MDRAHKHGARSIVAVNFIRLLTMKQKCIAIFRFPIMGYQMSKRLYSYSGFKNKSTKKVQCDTLNFRASYSLRWGLVETYNLNSARK